VKLLGRIVSARGIETDPSLIEAMVKFPEPKNVTGVRSFLALCNHYREFVDHFADISEPLTRLTRKSQKWQWSESEQLSFNKLKTAMTNTPCLAYPDWDKPFHMETDASLVGAGAVLLQEQADNKLHPVSYGSWLFNPAQRNYPTQWRELLAFVLATRKWKPYFYSRKFTSETDHRTLEGYLSLEDPYGKVARWHSELSQFNYSLKYKKGELNVVADSLSRNFEKIAILSETIGGLNENNTKEILSKRVSYYLAEAHNDDLEHEIIACVHEYSCPTSVQRLTLPNDEKWAIEQRNDENLNQIITYIEGGTLPDDDKRAKDILSEINLYAIKPENKILYRVSKLNPDDSDVTYRRCVPATWRKLILAEFHDSMWSGGHLGRNKTYEAVRSKYYFENMARYVDVWCASCEMCHRTKNKHPSHTKAPFGIIDAKFPWDLISIDIWSAGATSRSGNKYILSIIDVYSKFACVKAIPTEDESTVANALLDVFTMLGFPNRLHSDRGSQFTSNVLKELCKIFLVEKTFTTAYHPQGNGAVERIHQFFKNAVSAFVRSDHRDWDEVLRYLMPVYNNAIHEALGVSPAQVALSRSLGTIGYIEEQHSKLELTQMQFVQRVKYALQKVQAQIALRKEKKIQKNEESAVANLRTYQEGDKVALEVVRLSANDELSNKLSYKFQGPYTVIKKGRNEKVYYLKDAFDEELPHPVSIDRIKTWKERPIEEQIPIVDQKHEPSDEKVKELDDHTPLAVTDPTTNYVPPLAEAKELEANPPPLRPKSTRHSDRLKSAATDPLIGKRVRVKWPDGYRFGTVRSKCITAADKAQGTHLVKYEFDNNEYYERLDGSVKFDVVNCMLTRAF
jgi:hypothetical protein